MILGNKKISVNILGFFIATQRRNAVLGSSITINVPVIYTLVVLFKTDKSTNKSNQRDNRNNPKDRVIKSNPNANR